MTDDANALEIAAVSADAAVAVIDAQTLAAHMKFLQSATFTLGDLLAHSQQLVADLGDPGRKARAAGNQSIMVNVIADLGQMAKDAAATAAATAPSA